MVELEIHNQFLLIVLMYRFWTLRLSVTPKSLAERSSLRVWELTEQVASKMTIRLHRLYNKQRKIKRTSSVQTVK